MDNYGHRNGCPSAIIIIIFGTVSAAVCVSTFAYIMLLAPENEHVYAHDLCLPCPHLEMTMDREYKSTLSGLRRKVTNETIMCCADSSLEVSTVLELIARKQQRNRNPPQQPQALKSRQEQKTMTTQPIDLFGYSPVYAHKSLKSGDDNDMSKDRKPRFSYGGNPFVVPMEFYNRTDQMEVTRGVTVLKDGFKIETTGLYYIYHEISFNTNQWDKCETFVNQTFYSLVTLCKASNGQQSVLLRAEDTCCPGCINRRQSIFTAGQFYLSTDDTIGVKVTSFDIVNFDRKSTFFGLSMFGGESSDMRQQ